MAADHFPALHHEYASLPPQFFRPVAPTPVRSPAIVLWNEALADDLGVAPDADVFAGNRLPADSVSIAAAYAGHQFGNFVPQLGDGRAILLGEAMHRDGRLREIQLKGPGPTPFSRGGDGRCALGPALREFLTSEAMAALGIPTTRSLAVTATGEPVYRERPLPGAVLTRVSRGHVRVGTFQYFAVRGDRAAVSSLTSFCLRRLYPEVSAGPWPARDLYVAVRDAQASLIARWMLMGFLHGVMNTDNMSMAGETIDYGPCAFLDTYDPATVYSAIDRNGRYAFANQPVIAAWNLARLAETLLPEMGATPEEGVEWAQAALGEFPALVQRHWHAGMQAKLGLALDEPGDAELFDELLAVMHAGRADYTLTFRRLAEESAGELFAAEARERWAKWRESWHARLAREGRTPQSAAAGMRLVNPAYIPRNHQVEKAIVAAEERGDFAPARALHAVLAAPFEERPEWAEYLRAPRAGEWLCKTFCGT